MANRSFLMVLSSVFEGCYAEFFFEQILEIGLAGKEEKVGDCRKGSLGVG